MNPYDIIAAFEQKIAKYSGAKYGVAVNSCTNALLLCCSYLKVKEVILPSKTYVGVACSVKLAGGIIKFKNYKWKGAYRLKPYPIIDSARRFKKNMYVPGTFYCLSFHWYKHLPLGNGGMILTDDKIAYNWFKRARFDGRIEGMPPKEDNFFMIGYHCIMSPDIAAKGLILMNNMPDNNKDIPETEYSNLSKNKIFKE